MSRLLPRLHSLRATSTCSNATRATVHCCEAQLLATSASTLPAPATTRNTIHTMLAPACAVPLPHQQLRHQQLHASSAGGPRVGNSRQLSPLRFVHGKNLRHNQAATTREASALSFSGASQHFRTGRENTVPSTAAASTDARPSPTSEPL